MKSFSPEVVLYLHKSSMFPCMEYCCNAWVSAPSFHLIMLEKLQNQIWMAVGSSFVASLEPLAYCRNMATLSLFYRNYFGRY